MRVYTGHIPRLYNWKLHIGWRRDSFNRRLDLVKTADVKEKPLEWSTSESLFKREGLVFSFYTTCLARTESLLRTQNMHLHTLVIEMTPIYVLFQFRVCSDLVQRAAPHMYQDLKYVEEDDTEIPQLSPASEKKLIGQVAHAEWKHEIKKRINQSGKKLIFYIY